MASRDIDLHGCYPDEVEYLIASFIAECRAYGVSIASVIHGKGEGILKRAAVSALNRHKKDILSIEAGEDGHGGSLKVKFNFKTGKKKEYKSKQKPEKEQTKDYIKLVEEKRHKGKIAYMKRMKKNG